MDQPQLYSKPRSQSYDPRQHNQPQVISRNFLYNMNNIDRQYLVPLGTIQLQSSCYNRFVTYRELVAAIVDFNERLEKWHQGTLHIDSLMFLHNLHVNLSNRLLNLRLKNDEQAVLTELQSTKKWFTVAMQGDVDKQIGNLSGILQVIKNYRREGVEEREAVDDKDNIPMYKQMSRTQHSQFRPPRQRLRDFKRKELITPSTDVDNLITTKNTFFSDKAMAIDFRTNRNSFAVIESTNTTADKNNLDSLPASNEKTIETNLQQQQLIPKEQEDQDPGISEQQEQEEPQLDNLKKPYTSDAVHNKPQQRTLIKTANPPLLSGQRRILVNQEKEYYQRIQDSKAINQVKKWSKTKSRQATQLARRAEMTQQGNKFKSCAFELGRQKIVSNRKQRVVQGGYVHASEKHLKKALMMSDSDEQIQPVLQNTPRENIEQYVSATRQTDRPMSYIEQLRRTAPMKLSQTTKLIVTTSPFMSDSNNTRGFLDRAREVQKDIRQTCLTRTINTYSKYIRHTSQSTSRRQMQSDQQLMTLRQAALTSLPRSRCNSFGQILFKNRPDTYNDDAQTMVERIKAAMSSKGIPITAKILNSSLRVPMNAHYAYTDKLYKSGERLISNPWFPKNIGKGKKKKKK